MPKAHDVAVELRKLADSLDRNPDMQVSAPHLYMSYRYGGNEAKERFLELAKVLPRPLKKSYGFDGKDLELEFQNDALRIITSIERSKMCVLVEPAKEAVYRCEPVLSQIEEEAIAL